MPLFPLLVSGIFIGLSISVILTFLYNVNVKPIWLPSALLALGMGGSEWIKPGSGIVLVIAGVAAVLIMAFLGFGYSMYLTVKPDLKKARSSNKSGGGNLFNSLAKIVAILCIPLFFFTYPILLFLLFILIAIISSLLPSNKSRYLKLQRLLPTSKISALAMGLVEIQGEVNAEKIITSPLAKKKCIGYRYIVLRKENDRQEIISQKEEYLPLTIKDSTGTVAVDTVGLEWVNFSLSSEEWRGQYCHKEYLLEPKKKVVLIGCATLRKQKMIIVKDKVSKVFAMSPSDNLLQWNKNKPLVRSAIMYAIVAAFLIAIILTTPYQFDGKRLILHPDSSSLFNWIK